MTEEQSSRRRILTATGVGVFGSLAGCAGILEGDPDEESDDTTETTTSTSTPVEDGEPVVRIADLSAGPDPASQTDTITVELTAENVGTAEFVGRLVVDDGQDVFASEAVSIAPDGTETISAERELLRVGDHRLRGTIDRDGSTVDRDRISVRVERHPSSFVGVSGTEFTLDGAPFYYSGCHGGGMTTLTEASDPEFEWPDPLEYVDAFDGAHYVADSMQFAAATGTTVMRIACGPSTGGTDNVFHTGPGRFNETWFRHLDRIVADAKRNGVRLVVAFLSNTFQDEAPNPMAYANWSDTIDDSLDPMEKWNAFFHDDAAIGYYKELLEYVLTRENTITGVEYRNDPTIMLWECGNETQYAGEREGESLAGWYDEIARFIKSLDGNHLVGTGMYGSDDRNDFVADHASDAIDACSIHLYPKYANKSDLAEKPYDEPPWTDMSVDEVKSYVGGKIDQAHGELDKPIYVGEYNTPQYPELYGWDMETRQRFLRALFEVAAERDLNGTHAYALELHKKHTDEPKITDGRLQMGIYPGDEGTRSVIEEYGHTAEQKSGTTLG